MHPKVAFFLFISPRGEKFRPVFLWYLSLFPPDGLQFRRVYGTIEKIPKAAKGAEFGQEGAW